MRLLLCLCLLLPMAMAEEPGLHKQAHCRFSVVADAVLADIPGRAGGAERVEYVGFDQECFYFLGIAPPADATSLAVATVYAVPRAKVDTLEVVKLHRDLRQAAGKRPVEGMPVFAEVLDWSQRQKLQRAFPVD